MNKTNRCRSGKCGNIYARRRGESAIKAFRRHYAIYYQVWYPRYILRNAIILGGEVKR